jgi:hypothetical protein
VPSAIGVFGNVCCLHIPGPCDTGCRPCALCHGAFGNLCCLHIPGLKKSSCGHVAVLSRAVSLLISSHAVSQCGLLWPGCVMAPCILLVVPGVCLFVHGDDCLCMCARLAAPDFITLGIGWRYRWMAFSKGCSAGVDRACGQASDGMRMAGAAVVQ